MRDVLETLERWAADGTPVAIATVVDTERSAPRDPGASSSWNPCQRASSRRRTASVTRASCSADAGRP